MKKKVGLIINPIAGIGGAVGLKGSDGEVVQQLALDRGAEKKAWQKAEVALRELLPRASDIIIYAASGEMGENLAKFLGFDTVVIGTVSEKTSARDTESAAKLMAQIPIDVLIFAGGDGTARNICVAINDKLPVVGIPAGVKIHSAVYATTPTAAGKALSAYLWGGAKTHVAEVMDIDENEYRSGYLQAKLYGYLIVPTVRGGMQNSKAASYHQENDLGGLSHDIADRIHAENDHNICYIFGAGSTVNGVMAYLGLKGTLLGIDVVKDNQILIADANEEELLEIVQHNPCRLIITSIGGQGHIFGRGNQQLSPEVIRHIGLDHIWVVAAARKIYELDNQSLYVDTGDLELNESLRGYRKVIVGYQETLVCQVL